MMAMNTLVRRLWISILLGVVLQSAACQSPGHHDAGDMGIAATGSRLLALHPAPPQPEVALEARRLATVAEHTARQLAGSYGVRWPAWLHNCLVNTGVKQRGLCWQYMEDMFACLAAEHPVHYDLHCAVRDDGDLFLEHNCVVITAAGKDFTTGLVLDPWRSPGRLLVFRARGEGKPWYEQAGYTAALRRRAR